MRPDNDSLTPALTAYRAHLLRWNPQINLISRRSTEARVNSLFEQSLAGIRAVERHLRATGLEAEGSETPRLAYFDLGSGGGIPGIIWHLRLTAGGYAPQTCLVEPRSKRAWFLEKMVQQPDMPRFCILADRWGDDAGEEPAHCPGLDPAAGCETESGAGGTILISMKALRLTDRQVLAGLCRRSRGDRLHGERVLIVRYAPPDQEMDAELTEDLDLQEPGTGIPLPGCRSRAVRSWIETVPGGDGPCAGLVYSEHRIEG